VARNTAGTRTGAAKPDTRERMSPNSRGSSASLTNRCRITSARIPPAIVMYSKARETIAVQGSMRTRASMVRE
jgi:hypothetical protein